MRSHAPALVPLALLAGCVVVDLPGESTSTFDVTFPPTPARTGGANARDAGDITLATAPPPGFEEWTDLLNDQLALPHDIDVVHTECGVQNAYYSAEEASVYLCDELLVLVHAAMANAGLDGDDLALATGSAWLFVFLHEAGHALIDAYDIPVLGREEDAADDLATLVLLDAHADEAAIDAAAFWLLTDDQAYYDAKFADEHSLNPQRFYAILCTVYGSDPSAHAALVEYEYLPLERARRCPQEYQQKVASWGQALEPWEKR